MEELKYSFKHQMEKTGLDNSSFPEGDVEMVKRLRGVSKLKNLLKNQFFFKKFLNRNKT